MEFKTMNLHLFDGAAAEGGSESAAQAQVAESTAGEETAKATFDDLINGDYKEDFQSKVDEIIQKRFKNSKKSEEKLEKLAPVIEMFASRYGVEGDFDSLDVDKLRSFVEEDDSFYEQAAIDAGMDTKTFKEMSKLSRKNEALERQLKQRQDEENRQALLNNLMQQSEPLKAIYPGFDLATEMQNDEFMRLAVGSNVPVKTAFEVVHHDEIMAGAMQATAETVEKKIVNSIQSGIQRPTEQALSSQTSTKTNFDPSKLTKEQMAEIKKRVSRGERITFD